MNEPASLGEYYPEFDPIRNGVMETISPRLMTSILEDLRLGGRNGVTLKSILTRYLDGVTDTSDRRLIELTLSGAELL